MKFFTLKNNQFLKFNLLVFLFLVASKSWGQTSFTSTSVTTAWNTARWNNSADGPTYSSSFTANNNVSFTAGTYSFAGMGATVNVGNINVAAGVTVNFASTGNTFATNGLVRTITVGSGGLFDFNNQTLSQTVGTGFIKAGAGVLATGSAVGAFTNGFVLNEGTVIARGTTGFGTGNSLTLNGGTVAANATRSFDNTRFTGGITIGGNVQFGEVPANVTLANNTANLSFANDASLGSSIRTLTIGNAGTTTFSGIISGIGGGLIVGANANGTSGALTLSGSNTFSGGVTLNSGTLNMNNAAALGTGTFTINGGTIATNAGTTFTNALAIGGDFTFTGSQATFPGAVDLGTSVTRTITHNSTAALVFSSTSITGTSSILAINNTNTGNVTLSGTSNFTGGITVSGSSTGAVNFGSANGMPATGTIIVNDGGSLRFPTAGTYGAPGQSIVLNPNQTTNPVMFSTMSGNTTNTIARDITINTDSRIQVTGVDGFFGLSGIISGSGKLIKGGPGILSLTGTSNTFTGDVQVDTGFFRVNANNTLPINKNVVVNSRGTFWVNTNMSQTIQNLDLSGGGNLTVSAGATLTITGTFTPGTGTISNLGTIVLKGAAAQSFPGNLSTISNMANLTIDNTNGVTLNNSITVTSVLNILAGNLITGSNTLTLGVAASATIGALGTLSITGGTTNFASRPVTIQSTSAGTGRISTITGDNATTGLLNATAVTVQRYIPGNRRTSRFLSHPFSNTLTMASLIDNIYVTGDGTTAGTGGASPGTGFDATGTNAASSFWFDNGVAQAWKAFTTTSDASWTQYRGIRVLVRGDRSQPTALTGGNPSPNAVTLDMTGTLNTGDQTITLPTGYSVIGNPYPSPLNIGTKLDALTAPVIGTQYWVWDANAGPTAGAYVTRTIGSGAYNLAMNGAFVVQPAAGTSITFTESDKQVSATANLFRTTTASGQLELQVLYNNYPSDNMFVRFNTASSDNKDAMDGEKLNNPEVNLYALSLDSKKLSLDTRPFAENKIIPLGFTATAANSFKIKVADYGITEAIYLKDKYLNVTTQLFAGTEYSFSVDPSIAATLGENRFELMMKTNSALPATFLNVTAAQKNAGIEVSWTTANETNMSNYEVEESTDGNTFSKATSIAANNATTNVYNWFDGTVINGDNYYRIKAVEKNGTVKYSNVVKVKIGGKGAGFTVYPNPVKGGVVSLQMSNVEKGIYTVKIFNNIGQELAAKTINHNGRSATQAIDLGKGIASGTYNMQITNGTTVITKTVIVE